MYYIPTLGGVVVNGPVAHLVERVIRIDEASGSSPLGSTKFDLLPN